MHDPTDARENVMASPFAPVTGAHAHAVPMPAPDDGANSKKAPDDDMRPRSLRP
jgi:hypothetical protein